MKTVSTREIYESILAMRGYDPSNVNVASGEVARIQEFMNEHLRGVWEYAMWPKILLTERRRYRAAWDNEILYDEGAEVYYLDSGGRENYYVSLQGNNVDHQPALNDEWWAEVGPEFLPSIEFRQQGETEIGAVDLQHCVFDYDPRVYRARGKVLGVDFYMDSVVIAGRYWPMRPWVQFRPIAPTLSLQAWSSVKMYAIADVCYLASTGYSYRDWETDRKSTRLNSSHSGESRMPSSA